MGFGSRLRKTFTRTKSSTSPTSSTTSPTTSSSSQETYSTDRTDIEYYKPHEIPKSKYKGRVDPAHAERLNSYSFADAFNATRRNGSVALSGTFSPGGTKALSAAPSAEASRRPSWVSQRGNQSRRGSNVATANGVGEPMLRRRSVAAAGMPVGSPLLEETSAEPTMVNTETASHADLPSLQLQDTLTTTKPRIDLETSNSLPFSPEELERAMSRVTMTQTYGNGGGRRGSAMPQTFDMARTVQV